MNRKVYASTLAVAVFLLAAGCSTDEPSNSETAPQAESTTSPAEGSVTTDPIGSEESDGSLEGLRVAYLLTNPLSPFESDVWDEIEATRQEGTVSETVLIEMTGPTEYESTIREVSEAGFDLVVSNFFFVKEPMEAVAPEFPDTSYALVYEANEQSLDNLVGILYDVQEGSYACGVVAGLTTESNHVGFIGGNDSPGIIKFLAGYEAGFQSVNPDGQLDISFSGSFVDPELGRELAIAMYESGADVVMHTANLTGLGIFSAAEEADKYAIGVDIDQNDQAPDNVICSALSNPGASIRRVIEDVDAGTFDGSTWFWGLDDGPQSYAIPAWLPDNVAQAAAAAETAIRDGAVVPPTDTPTR